MPLFPFPHIAQKQVILMQYGTWIQNCSVPVTQRQGADNTFTSEVSAASVKQLAMGGSVTLALELLKFHPLESIMVEAA